MAKLFELRPNKSLLDPNFESYKLSLDQLPTYQHELPVSVEHLKPDNEQFSFQHAKNFGLHNHLVADLWHNNLAYFISKDHHIFRTEVHSLLSQHPNFKPVWEIPVKYLPRSGHYNPTLSFLNANIAIVSDGAGLIYIVDTSSRETNDPQPWQVLYTHEVFGTEKPFIILHSYLDGNEAGEINGLHALLLRVEPLNQVETQIPLSDLGCKEDETPFVSLLEWVLYTNKDGHWSLQHLRRIAVPRGVDYASILNPGKALAIVAREPLGLVYDSINSVATNSSITPEEKRKAAYLWSQHSDDVCIWFSLEKDSSKDDLKIEITDESLAVEYKTKPILKGQLSHKVDADSSSWTLLEGKLEIFLAKTVKDEKWEELVIGDNRGEYIPDPEALTEWRHRLIHLTSEEMTPEMSSERFRVFNTEQYEECDAFPADETYLFRLDGETRTVTHKASLGSHQVLFITQLSPNMAPALCLRHNVDGLIWQPMGDELESAWNCLHTATFQALGYVQASKEQRKFSVCPPNYSYAALCDALRHVYLYRQPGPLSSGVELTHRPTGKKVGSVAKQQVLYLDSGEEILGALAFDTILLILTSSSLFAIKVNDD
nr:EOG090X08S2 [Cyclestheria hislopi]